MATDSDANMTRRKRILLLNQEVDLCTLMRNYFRRKNYEVCISHHAQDAIQAINQTPPDIIITSMDNQDWELVRKHTSVVAPDAQFILNGIELKKIRKRWSEKNVSKSF